MTRRGAIGALLGLRAGELEGHVEKKTYDLFSKYPRADEIVLKNLIINLFCQMLNESKKSEDEKFETFFRFNDIVTRFQPPNPKKIEAYYYQLVDLNKRTQQNTAQDPFLSLSFLVKGLKTELSQDDYIQSIILPDEERVRRMGYAEMRFVNDLSAQISIYLKHSYPEIVGNDEKHDEESLKGR